MELVLDPTLLHQQEYWIKKADDSSLNHRNYIFCYFLNLTDEKVKSVNEFARKNDCEIIAIPYLHNEMEEYSEKQICELCEYVFGDSSILKSLYEKQNNDTLHL